MIKQLKLKKTKRVPECRRHGAPGREGFAAAGGTRPVNGRTLSGQEPSLSLYNQMQRSFSEGETLLLCSTHSESLRTVSDWMCQLIFISIHFGILGCYATLKFKKQVVFQRSPCVD
ncbi:hypothetical protein Anapl_12039 [Anas platyrhynchos]|uniref:Uncharacterized protein n=1 Tax=Anas platyrhynchos TaxID=8839 RepID=R0JAI9_ANAPL|nr:hypothetical protein Anapl_12039 [Anas platyrhynchos]